MRNEEKETHSLQLRDGFFHDPLSGEVEERGKESVCVCVFKRGACWGRALQKDRERLGIVNTVLEGFCGVR